MVKLASLRTRAIFPFLVAMLSVIVLAVISEMAGVLGGERRYDGPMGKSDRAAVFSVVGLLVGLGVPVGQALNWIWSAVIALLVLTIANRIRRGM